MNLIPSIPQVTSSSFDGHVLRSELPVLVIFCADGDRTSRHLFNWLNEWTPAARNLLNIVQVPQLEARSLAARWGMPSVPSLALFHAGSVCYQFCGQFSRRELDDVLTQAIFMGLARHLAPPPERGAVAGSLDLEP
jgi:thioredoxin 1